MPSSAYQQGDKVEYRPVGGATENVSHSTGTIASVSEAEDGSVRYAIKNDNTGKTTNYQLLKVVVELPYRRPKRFEVSRCGSASLNYGVTVLQGYDTREAGFDCISNDSIMSLLTTACIAMLVWVADGQSDHISGLGPSAYTIPGLFPTSVYQSYYNDPTATSVEPQPVISDPVTHETYPYWLSNPETIPQYDTYETHPLPPVASPEQLLDAAFTQVLSIAANPVFGNDTCARCQASLEVAKFLALTVPELVPQLAVRLCEQFNFTTDSMPTCALAYGRATLGAFYTQVAAYADVGGYDGQAFCATFFSLCPIPPTSPLDLTNWFAKPKPDPLPPPKQPTGERLKVLHVSDLHIDPRYTIGAEANCSQFFCCRPQGFDISPDQVVFPAPRYGSYLCDVPLPTMVGVMKAIPILTGTEGTGFDFTIFTGDLVSHDPENELSKVYTVYTEVIILAQNSPYDIPGNLSSQFNWNYDHLAALWELEEWISPETAQQARTHYAAYAVQRQDGLRIITLNTDMCKQNFYNYINLASSDNSGMLRFLTDELQEAEDAGDRELSTADLISHSVDRFSPHVIAGIFFGHTHEDQMTLDDMQPGATCVHQIFYANNGTVMTKETAQMVSWTFEILDSYTWFADVNSFPELDGQTEFGPTYKFEYSARETYGSSISGWGPNDPLNATWWHLVTEAMENDTSLVTVSYSTDIVPWTRPTKTP
ncbi:hypothetical protein POSPLADRAFT_1048946 [Postia placenta MAD-698-R-SB12]|uniref:Calcineurin-like phosphoesterase domain-containing protein n=1 Tax=Postia placenta MAD-698-R-SB12 TaxID=670580 RepID=A0A1X6MQU6_9APHY|nr:hypothetical protein POSPLADRAFT_1048946 [Postia placenta MAD-698-R-SB12]OSX58747.1 hypothetical protein POSPLADRAFT_1048946 [Postia placenta MAD-698-R-SB12]